MSFANLMPRVLLAGLALATTSRSTYAQAACDPEVGRFLSIEGSVEVQRASGGRWWTSSLESDLCEGDTIRVGNRSRAAVALVNEALLRINQNSAVRLVDILEKDESTSVLDMIRGAFQSFSRKPRLLKVNTPYLNGSVEGTEFVVKVEDQTTRITVFEGVVLAANEQGRVAIEPGEAAEASAGQAPRRRTVVRPRDEVNWALYYPPILSVAAIAASSGPLRQAADCAASGDTPCAFEALRRVPPGQRQGDYLLLRASLLLSVGRVAEASPEIDAAIAGASVRASAAHALRAVIRVTQNDVAGAVSDGQRALALDPGSTEARIALSYALQASLALPAARELMAEATETDPQNALAWARLAELELMLGNRRASLEAAGQAKSIAPNLSRAELVLGFSALASFRNQAAMAAFERATRLDSADPLARLGLGLARISDGQLEAGRGDLEAAVALDSNNALLRAYLGKAYFEERRDPLDGEQYAIAKQLDPKDPTAFLYDGIRKQTINRPVEAVRDLEKSIELNDNRAVYRSRLLLDQDRAARGTSLARAYNDLGFRQLATNAAARSLSADPANASAHRFLADSYLGTRRTDIARVSETLQAQLLQDLNINPVQPSFAGTNLNIVTLGGAAQPGFNEFTPLFQRNDAQVNATFLGGNNDTYGGEAVVSGVYGRFSFSAGATSYDTDGWRPNNGIDTTLYNAFAQWALTDELNIQAEYQHQESTEGDLAFNFDPDDFLMDKTLERDESSLRFGIRYSPTRTSSLLFSYIHNDSEETLSQSDQLDPFTLFDFDAEVEDEGDQYEAQYLHHGEGFNATVGAAYNQADRRIFEDFRLEDPELGPLFSVQETTRQEIEHPRGYVYSQIPAWNDRLTWTLGLSYDRYEEGILEETSWNPKLGLQWSITDALSVRAAAFKTLKPLLVNNRTLEPTQVAGFNQFFDDINGTKSWRYGLGIDWRINQDLATGIELTHRELDEPVFILFEEPPRADFEDRAEDLHRLYLYWTPSPRWALSGQAVYDRYTSETGEATEFGDLPRKVRTFSVPLVATYFHPSGLFGGLKGTYVDQDVRRSPAASGASGEERFFLVDFAIGYRFPKRRGMASLGVKNLFDEAFRYQDDSFREFSTEASTGPYFPQRTIVGQLTLSF